MKLREVADILCVFALFCNLLGDVFACVFLNQSNERSIAYNGFQLQHAPIYACSESPRSRFVYGLGTLFAVHVVVGPLAMLAVNQNPGGIVSYLLLANLLVGYLLAAVYFGDMWDGKLEVVGF